MKAGHIEYVLARDMVNDSPKLRIQVLEDDGTNIGEIELVADDLRGDEDRKTVELFALGVEQARRKAGYVKQFSNRDRSAAIESVKLELERDTFEWHFRQRGDKERWEGLGDKAVHNARLQE